MLDLELDPAYTTPFGECYNADALDVLRQIPDDSISLVLTSPPFALRRKKEYGNVDPTEYVEWLMPFAEEIYRILRPDGSFVFDLGGAWNRGSGTKSLFQYELILPPVPILPPGAGVLLVQPQQAADAGRMGHHPPHARQGRGQHAVVAVENRHAQFR